MISHHADSQNKLTWTIKQATIANNNILAILETHITRKQAAANYEPTLPLKPMNDYLQCGFQRAFLSTRDTITYANLVHDL